MTEIWGCHTELKLTMDEIYKMPIRNRKYFIMLHNKRIEQQNEELEEMSNSSTANINTAAKQAQGVIG